jgi:hypothetical protein
VAEVDVTTMRPIDEVPFQEYTDQRQVATRNAPQANAHAERFVRTARTECLDWLLIVGPRQLDRVLRVYVDHYNTERPHRALGRCPPVATEPPTPPPRSPLSRDSSDATDSAASCTRTTSPQHDETEYWHPSGSRRGARARLSGSANPRVLPMRRRPRDRLGWPIQASRFERCLGIERRSRQPRPKRRREDRGDRDKAAAMEPLHARALKSYVAFASTC